MIEKNIRRHNRICPGACAANVADTGKAENIEPKIFELAIGTLKIESGTCDLPPEGSKKSSLIDLSKF